MSGDDLFLCWCPRPDEAHAADGACPTRTAWLDVEDSGMEWDDATTVALDEQSFGLITEADISMLETVLNAGRDRLDYSQFYSAEADDR